MKKRLLCDLLLLVTLATPLRCLAQSTPPPESGSTGSLNLDLSSSNAGIAASSIIGGSGGQVVTIDQGGSKVTVTSGSSLTAAQYVAVAQVLAGSQSIQLSSLGTAVGGSVQVGQFGTLSNLVIPQGVTAYSDFGINNALNVVGNFTNSGQFFAVSSVAHPAAAVISAQNIFNQSGALLSSVLPTTTGLLPGGFYSPALDLSLIARESVVNMGTIVSSGNLNITAGSSISNVLSSTTALSSIMQAVGNINLSCQTMANQGLISSSTANINAITSNLVNSGAINAMSGNVAISSPGSSLNVLNIGGSISAANRLLLSTILEDGIKGQLLIEGGDLSSSSIDLVAPSAVVAANLNSATGKVGVTAGLASIGVNAGDLQITRMDLSGDPIFYSSGGNLDLSGIFSTPVFSTAGGDFVALAKGNITASTAPAGATINAASPAAAGGKITIASGVTFTVTGGASPIACSNCAGLYSITGSSGTGGSVSLAGVDLTTNSSPVTIQSAGSLAIGAIATNGSLAARSGGAVTLSAAQNVQTGSVRTFGAGGAGGGGSGSAAGAGGAISISSTSGSITVSGDLNSSGGGGGGGNNGSGGAGGNAGVIAVSALNAVTVAGPVLAAGGGGGGSTAGSGGQGGGSFGGGGGFGTCCGPSGAGGTALASGGGALYGLGAIGNGAGGNVGEDGSAVAGGVAGSSANVTLSGATVNVSGTIGSAYSPLSAVVPNPFSSSPYASISVAGKSVAVNATSGVPTFNGTVAISNGGALSITNAGSAVTSLNSIGYFGKSGGSATLSQPVSGVPFTIGTLTLYSASGGTFNISSADAITIGAVQTSLDARVKSTTVLNLSAAGDLRINSVIANSGTNVNLTTSSGNVFITKVQSSSTNLSVNSAGSVSTGDITVSGAGGLTGGPVAGAAGGAVFITAAKDITTGFIRTFGGGGAGNGGSGGVGGAGGDITMNSSAGQILVLADLNSSGGGGGGGNNGIGGNGGKGGAISVTAPLSITVQGPVLAVGGGGGGGSNGLGGAGGGSFGASGGVGSCCGTGPGGSTLTDLAGPFFGLGSSSASAGGSVGTAGSGNAGAGGASGDVSMSAGTIAVNGTIATGYGALSTANPNPYTQSPYANIAIAGKSVTLASATATSVNGTLVVGNGGSLSSTVAGAQVTNYSSIGYIGAKGGTGSLSLNAPGAALSITTVNLFETANGGKLALSSQGTISIGAVTGLTQSVGANAQQTLQIDAPSDINIGSIQTTGSSIASSSTGGNVTLGNVIAFRSSISASSGLRISTGTIDTSGGTPGGSGGAVSFSAGTDFQSGYIRTFGAGGSGLGGSGMAGGSAGAVSISAGATLSITADVNASGGGGGGGNNGAAGKGGNAASISLTAGGAITVTGPILAVGGGAGGSGTGLGATGGGAFGGAGTVGSCCSSSPGATTLLTGGGALYGTAGGSDANAVGMGLTGGSSAVVTLDGDSVAVAGTIGSSYGPLVGGTPNRFTNSPFANVSIAGKAINLSTVSAVSTDLSVAGASLITDGGTINFQQAGSPTGQLGAIGYLANGGTATVSLAAPGQPLNISSLSLFGTKGALNISSAGATNIGSTFAWNETGNFNLMTVSSTSTGNFALTSNLAVAGLNLTVSTSGSLTSAGIWVAGIGGAGGIVNAYGSVASDGGRGGNVSLTADNAISINYVRSYGGGGGGSYLCTACSGGDGGAGGKIDIVSKSGTISVSGDLNSSGGGGGGSVYTAGAGGAAGDINIGAVQAITINGPVLAAGGGAGNSNAPYNQAGGGGSFGGGGGSVPAASGGGGFQGGGGATTGAGIGSTGGGMVGGTPTGFGTPGSLGAGGSSDVAGTSLFGSSASLGTPVGLGSCCTTPSTGAGGTVSITGQSISITGTVASAFSSLSSLNPNPFSNSPFADYSLAAKDVKLTATSGTGTNVSVAGAVAVSGKASLINGQDISINRATFYLTGAVMALNSAGSTTLGSASTTVVNSSLAITAGGNVAIIGAVVLPESKVTITGAAVSLGSVNVSGLGGMSNRTTGGSGGIISLTGTSLSTGYLRAFGGGGFGAFSGVGGTGGDGGKVTLVSSSTISVTGDINVSGGGGGGNGTGGTGGKGGAGGTIDVASVAATAISGPVLAAGGGGGRVGGYLMGGGDGGGSFGGGGGSWLDAAGGGLFGGGSLDYNNTGGGIFGGGNPNGLPGKGGASFLNSGGIFGVGGNGQNQVARPGAGTNGGAGGSNGYIAINGSSVTVSGTVSSTYSPLSALVPNPFSTSPFSNVSIYGGAVTLGASASFVQVNGDIRTNSSQSSGNVTATAISDITVGGKIDTTSGLGQGGNVTLTSGGGTISVNGAINTGSNGTTDFTISGFLNAYSGAVKVTNSNNGMVLLNTINTAGGGGSFGGDVIFTLNDTASLNVQGTVDTSSSQNTGGDFKISGTTSGAISVNTNGIPTSTAVKTSGGGVDHYSGAVRVLLVNAPLTVIGGINTSATTQATSGEIVIDAKNVSVSGLINSGNTTGRGATVDISAATNVTTANINTASTTSIGGLVMMASGVGAPGSLVTGTITTSGFGSTSTAGSVVLLSSGSITVGAVTAVGAGGAAGGNVSFVAGKSGTAGNIAFSSVNASGAAGGNLTAVSLGDTGLISNGSAAINTSANGLDLTAGSLSMSSRGSISVGNIDASAIAPGSTKSYAGSVFIGAGGSGTSIVTGNINLASTNYGGNLVEVFAAGSSASSGTVNQSGAVRNGYTFAGVPTGIVTDIVADQTLTFGVGGVTGYSPGGFNSANAPAATLSVDTQGDSRLFVPLVVLNGDVNLLGVTSIVSAGAASPVSVFATGNITLGSGVTVSSANAPAAPVSFQSNQGNVSLASVDLSGTTGGSIVISSPTSFTLAPGQSLKAISTQAGSTGGRIIVAVPNGSITLGAPGNTSLNVIDASGPNGGLIQLEARGNVDLYEVHVTAKSTANGGVGGTATIASYNGTVNMYGGGGFNSDIDVSSVSGTGGTVSIFGKTGINSLTDAAIGGVGAQVINANGGIKGGTISFQSPQGDIYLGDAMSVTATGAQGGSISGFAPLGTLTATNFDVTGTTGGTIDSATSNFVLPDGKNILALGTAGAGGTIGIYTAGVKVNSPGFVRLGDSNNTSDNKIDSSGTTTGGSITIFSGTSFATNEVSLLARGGSGKGGTIAVYAYGSTFTIAQLYGLFGGVPTYHMSNIDAGSNSADGGVVTLQSGSALTSMRDGALSGAIPNTSIIGAVGAAKGGSISVYSGTNIDLTETSSLMATGGTAPGGTVAIQSLLGAVLTSADATGSAGGAISAISGKIDLLSGRSLTAVGTVGDGGTVTLTNVASKTGNYIQLGKPDNRSNNAINVSGANAGGTIQITSLADFTDYETSLRATGGTASGGTVNVSTTDGNITFYNEFFGAQNYNADIDVSSTGSSGGAINLAVSSTTLNPFVKGLQDTTAVGGGSSTQKFQANGGTKGGSITVTSRGDFDFRQMSSIQAGGPTGGTVTLRSINQAGYTGNIDTSASGGNISARAYQGLTLSGNANGDVINLTSDNSGIVLDGSAIGSSQVNVTAPFAISYISGTLGGGTVKLQSTFGNIGAPAIPVQTSGSGLLANTSGGEVRLVQTGTTNLGASHSGNNFNLTSDSDITIVNPLTASNITIATTAASNASININDNPTAGTKLTLDAGGKGQITQTSGVQIGAPTLVLSSGSGDIGSGSTALSTATSTLTANTSGNVHVSNSTALTLLGSSSGGTFDLTTNGDFILANPLNSPIVVLSTTAASKGNITINANPVGTNTLTLNAGGTGTIIQAPALSFGFNNVNLSSDTGSIGTTGTPIRTAANNLTVNTAGAVHVAQTGAVNLGLSSSGLEFVLNSTGTITTSNKLSSADLTLMNSAANGQITIGGAVNSTGPVALQTSGSGTVALTAGASLVASGNITAAAATLTNDGNISGTVGIISVSSPGVLTIGGTGSISTAAPGGSILLSPTAGNAVLFSGNQTLSAASVLVDGSSKGGSIQFAAGTTQSITGNSAVRLSSANLIFGSGAALNASGPASILFDSSAAAPDLSFNMSGKGATVSTGGGTIGITPSPGGKVTFAGSGVLNLDGGVVSINSPSQNVTVSGGVTVSTNNNLSITATGVQNAGSMIATGSLSVSGSGVELVTGTGSLSAASIDVTSTTSTVTVNQGSITGPLSGSSIGDYVVATTAGDLTLGSITATGGSLTADATGGAVNVIDGGKLTAGKLMQLTAASDVLLGQGGNSGVLLNTPGDVTLAATSGRIVIDDLSSITGNNQKFSATTALLVGKAGGNGVSFNSSNGVTMSVTGGGIVISDGGAIDGKSSPVNLSGAGGVTLGQGGKAVNVSSAGDVSIDSSAGSVSVGDKSIIQGRVSSLTSATAMTLGTAGGAGVTLTSTGGSLTTKITSGGLTGGDKIGFVASGDVVTSITAGDLIVGDGFVFQSSGAKVDINLSNGKFQAGNGGLISASTGITASTTGGGFAVGGNTTLNSNTGNIIGTINGDLAIGNNSSVTARGGDIQFTLINGNFTAGTNETISASGAIGISGNDFNLGNASTVTASGGSGFSATMKGDVVLGANDKFTVSNAIDVSGANFTSGGGNSLVANGGGLTLTMSGNFGSGANESFMAGQSIQLNATSLTAGDNNTFSAATGDMKATASTGSLSIGNQASVTAANVQLQAATDMTLGKAGGTSFGVTASNGISASASGVLTVSDGANFRVGAGAIGLAGTNGVVIGQGGHSAVFDANTTFTASSSSGAVLVADRVTVSAGSDLQLLAATGITVGSAGGVGSSFTAGRLSAGYSAASVSMAAYDMSAVSSPGMVLLQSSAGPVRIGDNVQMTSIGASLGMVTPGDFVFGTGNRMFAQGGNIWLNGAGEVTFGLFNAFTAVARNLPNSPDLTIDGQTIQDYQGGSVAIDVSGITPNYDQYLTNNFVMNRLAGGTLSITGSVNTTGTIPQYTNGGSLILKSTGAGHISAQNSVMQANGGIVFVDPPGDIMIDSINISAIGPGLIPPPPPPPVVVVVAGGPAALVTATTAGTVAATTVGTVSSTSLPSRPTVPTDTQDFQMSVKAEPTAPYQVMQTGLEYQVSAFCQPFLLQNEDDAGIIGSPGTVFVREEGPGETVSLKGGKLLVVSGRKPISVQTNQGTVVVPSSSTAIVEQRPSGPVRLTGVAGKPAQMTLSNGVDRRILEALPGQEIAAGDVDADDEELIPADGVERELISSSIIFAKSRVLIKRFRGDQMANIEVILHCNSNNRLQRRIDKDRENMRAADADIKQHGTSPSISKNDSSLSPVAYNLPMAVSPAKAVLMPPLASARIVSTPETRIQQDGTGKVIVRNGEVFIEAHHSMLINLQHCTVKLCAGDIVLIETSSGQDRVQLLWSSAHNTCILASAQMIKLNAGAEAIVSFGAAPRANDGISRRRIVRQRLDNQRQLAVSEVSLVSIISCNKLMNQVLHSKDHKRSIEKIKKMAAILSMVLSRHGAYNNSDFNNGAGLN